METRYERATGGLSLLAGSFLLVGGLILTRPLLDPDPTLPADPGPLLVELAAQYRGTLLLYLVLALTGLGIAVGIPALAGGLRRLHPPLMDHAARWGFAAGLLWILRSLFLATVRGPWALRFAGDLEPAVRKQAILEIWPLMRQVDWFFQWSAVLCMGAAFLCAGLACVPRGGKLAALGAVQLVAAAAVLVALVYVPAFHYPLRFAGPGFPRAGVYAVTVLLYETAALAMLGVGAALWFGLSRHGDGPD